ncbi:DUF805 domain-containing protein [Vibrio marisflavi]|uniref:DUF805 domain-containing protein n=1 Tax=Vibrio marisflavi CECT 7928 TaxID=634439 RepID=A0ABN8EAX5_9VIBR|nr:DUF805 domain-containing protein [Vibrio marisflavi]CAH0542829.1 hypothetical protein VMF7928_04226 [Vibrio marisflavi CECT 7928]
MYLRYVLFSFKGRINRSIFWYWNIAYYLLIVFVVGMASKAFPMQAEWISAIFLLLMLYPDLAVTAKRWQDRGKSNWWLLLNIPVIIGRLSIPAAGVAATGQFQLWGSLLALICGAWILIECGLLKGDDAENKYGPVPI